MNKKMLLYFKMLLVTLFLVSISYILLARPATASVLNEIAIKDVMNGTRTEANASWWGFDESDSTTALQAAIRSKAKKIIIPNMGRPWIVNPIFLESDKEVVFEKGVIIAAKPGSFLGKTDSLFTINNKKNITITGYGAQFVMRKQDYVHAPYVKAEWRNCINILGSQNISICGLRIADSGGDGIYIGRSIGKDGQPYSAKIHIKDVVSDNNFRQGISVISASDLLIEHCIFQNTAGTPPQAGIDFEPNRPDEVLRNCKITKCIMQHNLGFGILIYVPSLDKSSSPISLEFDECTIVKNKGGAVFIAGRDTKDRIGDPRGEIVFKSCALDGPVKKRKPQHINITVIDSM